MVKNAELHVVFAIFKFWQEQDLGINVYLKIDTHLQKI